MKIVSCLLIALFVFQTELEEIESRAEEFPLTRAMLRLLDVLTNCAVPRLLGVGTRAPGFDPYLNYVLHSVFLKAPSRSYQKPQEKVRKSVY